MATSPIYSWPEPDNTDLVKNGALAIRTLGNAIDTTMGTMVAKTIIDAKGDLIAGTAADTAARLAVGTNGQVLTADSTAATGLAWATAGSTSGPAFRAFRNTSQQSFSASTWTKIQFNGETFDTANCFDSTTNYRFTPTTAGYYQINLAATWSGANATTVKALAIYKNGATYAKCFDSSGSGTPGAGAAANGGDLVYFNGSTDYVEGYIYDSDGAARNVVNGSADSYFSGVWIRS
jgi:hypothetical protein